MVRPISTAEKLSAIPLFNFGVAAGTILSNLFKCLVSDPLSKAYFIPRKLEKLERKITDIKIKLKHDMTADKEAIGQLHEKILERDRLLLEGTGFKEHAQYIGIGIFRVALVIANIYYAIKWLSSNRAEEQLKTAEQLFKQAENETDPKKALECYESAANLGLASAQTAAGLRYLDTDKKKAEAYLEKAADQGDTTALEMKGHIHLENEEYATALNLFLKAAANKRDSSLSLAYMYQRGQGVQKDNNKALEYALAATRLGDSQAYLYVGALHIDMNNDLDTAIKYFEIAKTMGAPKAEKMIDEARFRAGQEKIIAEMAQQEASKKAEQQQFINILTKIYSKT